jgi:hypothetical protein
MGSVASEWCDIHHDFFFEKGHQADNASTERERGGERDLDTEGRQSERKKISKEKLKLTYYIKPLID